LAFWGGEGGGAEKGEVENSEEKEGDGGGEKETGGEEDEDGEGGADWSGEVKPKVSAETLRREGGIS